MKTEVNKERNLTITELASELEIGERAIRKYLKLGCPVDRSQKPFRFNRAEMADWMAKQELTGKPGRPTQPVSDEIKAAQLRVLRAKAEKHEMEVAKLRGEYLAKEDVDASNVKKILTIKARLLGMPASIAPQLVGITVPEIQAKLEDEMRHLLEQFSRE